jgi:hypothetical protein
MFQYISESLTEKIGITKSYIAFVEDVLSRDGIDYTLDQCERQVYEEIRREDRASLQELVDLQKILLKFEKR